MSRPLPRYTDHIEVSLDFYTTGVIVSAHSRRHGVNACAPMLSPVYLPNTIEIVLRRLARKIGEITVFGAIQS